MQINKDRIKSKNVKNYGNFSIFLFLLFIISFAFVVLVIPQTLAAKVTMEVYQQSDGKVFGKETNLDIFSNDNHYLDGENLLAPFSSGSYTFAVYNNSISDLLPYALSIESTNKDNIPLVFSLRKNGVYIYGGANDQDMIPLTLVEFSEILLQGNKTDLFTLEWRWETESDEIDTAFGTEAVDRDLIYSLKITAVGSIDETNLPTTGDNSNILIWLITITLSLITMIIITILLIINRRKKEENNENIS